jgi:hypothetical protein
MWLGHKGVAFIEKNNGRHINPNAMVECWDQSTWIFVKGTCVHGSYNYQNVTDWSHDTIAAWFDFPTTGGEQGKAA